MEWEDSPRGSRCPANVFRSQARKSPKHGLPSPSCTFHLDIIKNHHIPSHTAIRHQKWQTLAAHHHAAEENRAQEQQLLPGPGPSTRRSRFSRYVTIHCSLPYAVWRSFNKSILDQDNFLTSRRLTRTTPRLRTEKWPRSTTQPSGLARPSAASPRARSRWSR